MKTKLLLLLFLVVFATSNLHAADFTVDGVVYTITSATSPYTVAVRSKSPGYAGSVTIPAKVSYNSISYSVTSIGEQAFQQCTGLTAVTIPNSVTFIGIHAFYYCTGLTSVTIPNSVTSLGNGAFQNCTGFTSVTIPSSLTTIGLNAFNGCTGLTSVFMPNTVTTIGNSAFINCPGLTSVNIPNSVTTIEDWAFAFCPNLTFISLPNSVTYIGKSAFRLCSGLTVVAIPASVTSIGDQAFEGCSSLISIYADNPTPIVLSGSSVFAIVNKTTCTLYVPTGSINLYASAIQWKDFVKIVEHKVGIANLFNGEFDNSTQNWNLYYATGTAATMKIDNNSVISGPNSCAVTISQTSGPDWNIQLWQSLSVYQEHKYTISFKAKASAARSIALVLQKHASPYTTYHNKPHNLTTQVQTFTDTVTMHTTDLAAIIQFSLASSAASVWIDAITIVDTPLITGIDEPDATHGNQSVLQNYPNPFTSTTTIKYKITEPGFVSLKVFNAIGTEVATLINEKKPVGEYSIDWNAAGLGSGIYFCKLQNGNFSESKKMLLMK